MAALPGTPELGTSTFANNVPPVVPYDYQHRTNIILGFENIKSKASYGFKYNAMGGIISVSLAAMKSATLATTVAAISAACETCINQIQQGGTVVTLGNVLGNSSYAYDIGFDGSVYYVRRIAFMDVSCIMWHAPTNLSEAVRFFMAVPYAAVSGLNHSLTAYLNETIQWGYDPSMYATLL